MLQIDRGQSLIHSNYLKFSVCIVATVFCLGSVQAVDNPIVYCLNAGAENNYNCAQVDSNRGSRREEINSKLSELQRWFEDEESSGNGESRTSSSVQHVEDKKLQHRIELNSRLLASELLQIQALRDSGDHVRASGLIDRYLSDNPQDPNGWLIYGVSLMDRGKLQAAEDVFSKLTLIYPDVPEPYNNLAAISARRGDSAKAIDLLLQAFSTHPSYAQVQLNLKAVYASLAAQVNNRIHDLEVSDSLVRPNLGAIDQVYIAKPIEALACIKPETAFLADRLDVNLAKRGGQQSFSDLPAISLKKEAVVDLAADEKSETKVKPEPSSINVAGINEVLLVPDSEIKEHLTNIIYRWSSAWSMRDVKQYTNFYVDQYQPIKTVAHTQWVRDVENRFSEVQVIQVRVSNISMVAMSHGRIRTVFQHTYESNSRQESIFKTLIFSPVSGKWKISAEAIL